MPRHQWYIVHRVNALFTSCYDCSDEIRQMAAAAQLDEGFLPFLPICSVLLPSSLIIEQRMGWLSAKLLTRSGTTQINEACYHTSRLLAQTCHSQTVVG